MALLTPLPRVYVETSVISYLTSRASSKSVLRFRQERTMEFWGQIGILFDPIISTAVLDEIKRGNFEAAKLRVNACSEIKTYEVTQEASELASNLIATGALPDSEPEDAMHVAMAQILDADYLASWNFVHLVGPHAKLKLQLKLGKLGLKPIPISTPDEILEEIL